MYAPVTGWLQGSVVQRKKKWKPFNSHTFAGLYVGANLFKNYWLDLYETWKVSVLLILLYNSVLKIRVTKRMNQVTFIVKSIFEELSASKKQIQTHYF